MAVWFAKRHQTLVSVCHLQRLLSKLVVREMNSQLEIFRAWLAASS